MRLTMLSAPNSLNAKVSSLSSEKAHGLVLICFRLDSRHHPAKNIAHRLPHDRTCIRGPGA
mgnify:CR=1 FL=1